MKKISIIVLILSLFIITGCDKEKEVKVNGEKIDTSKMEHKHCIREATMTGGEVNLDYDIYYIGDKLEILKSEEKVTSDSEETLNTYEEAYKKIHSNYEGIEYYDTKVERTDNSVTSYITINYAKIDADKLIAIEGEKDNVFENKKAKVSKWITLAKKFGTKCVLVED